MGVEKVEDQVSRYLSSLPITTPVDTTAILLNPASSSNPIYSAFAPIKKESDPTIKDRVVISCQEQSKRPLDLNPDAALFNFPHTMAMTSTSCATQYPLMYGDHNTPWGKPHLAEANITTPFREISQNAPPQDMLTRDHRVEIADAIAESKQAARLPPPKLMVFDGNPLDWPT